MPGDPHFKRTNLCDIDSVLLDVAPSCTAHSALPSLMTLDGPGLREETLCLIILGEAEE